VAWQPDDELIESQRNGVLIAQMRMPLLSVEEFRMGVLFIQLGMGVDLHGQDATVAAVRAVRDAIGHNSLPGMRRLLPGYDINRMRVSVTFACPVPASQIDLDEVKRTFPHGMVSIEVVPGGMMLHGGAMRAELGDRSDEILVVNAAVEIGD
jgi:uncharacterized protein (TIGR02058 family)